MSRLRRSNLLVGSLVVVGIAGMFAVPYMLTKNTKPLLTKDGPLTGSQRQRGMYLNSGVDLGVDPDWDMKERKWKGYKRPPPEDAGSDKNAESS